MKTNPIIALILQLLLSVPMFYATYWSWMLLTMLTGLFLLPIVLAFLMSMVVATLLVLTTGWLLGLRGRLAITLVGACIGAVIGGVLFIPFLYHWLVMLFGSLPTLGAIIAFQWSAARASASPIE